MSESICVSVKDGKIIIARKGQSIFTEPISKDILVIRDNQEAFLVGPYPEKNTMIMPFDKYHRTIMELRNNCPNARSWKITASVFISMFIILSAIHFHQWAYSKDMYRRATLMWKKHHPSTPPPQ